MNAVAHLLADTAVIAKRNAIKIIRVPEVMVFVLISPIMFVLMFAYVFGGSIAVAGSSYREFLVPGIFTQTVVFGSTFTGVGIAEDMQKGIINRFRSLPMSPGALLAGRTLSDGIYNVLTLVIMALTGLAVGWRIRGSALDALWGFVLLLLFGYGISWVMALVGLVVPSVEVVNNASFIVIFPATFVANTFVESGNLPSVLQTVAEWNPVSTATHAARLAFGNTDGTDPGAAWPLQHPTVYTLICAAVLVAVFAPLATARYRRSVKK